MGTSFYPINEGIPTVILTSILRCGSQKKPVAPNFRPIVQPRKALLSQQYNHKIPLDLIQLPHTTLFFKRKVSMQLQ